MAEQEPTKPHADAKEPGEEDFWLSDPKYPEAVFKVIGFSALTGATVRLISVGLPYVSPSTALMIGWAVGLWLYYMLVMYAMGAVADPYFQHRKAHSKRPLEGRRRTAVAWIFVVALAGIPGALVLLNLFGQK